MNEHDAESPITSEESHVVEPQVQEDDNKENQNESPLEEEEKTDSSLKEVGEIIGEGSHEEDADNDLDGSNNNDIILEALKNEETIPSLSDRDDANMSPEDGREEEELNEALDELREIEDHEPLQTEYENRILDDDELEEAKNMIKTREELTSRYTSIIEDRNILWRKLHLITKKLSDHFKSIKKISNEEAKEKSLDSEDKYSRLIMEYRDLREELEELREKNRQQLGSMRSSLDMRQQSADAMRLQLMEHKTHIATEKAKGLRTGKRIPAKKLEELHRAELDKYYKVRSIRIQNFELKNTKQALDQSIREKEEFSKGLHLIHYEQLKMENSSLSEKIEEKNESLQKAQLKSINAVHVWAHTREKLQFEQNQDTAMEARLGELETEIEQYKKDLNMIKTDSDKMKQDTMAMRNAAPLVTNTPLLMDYENRKNELEEKTRTLQQLKDQHREHLLHIKKYNQRMNNMLRKYDKGSTTTNPQTMTATHQPETDHYEAEPSPTSPQAAQKLPDIYKRVNSSRSIGSRTEQPQQPPELVQPS